MFFDDAPINKTENDRLNRATFSKKLAKSLLEMPCPNGICIGVYGKWGSGKTSVVNMVLEEIDKLCSDYENEPFILSFNPWNFTNTEQLYRQFFYMLAEQFTGKSQKNLSAFGKEIMKYADLAGGLGIKWASGALAAKTIINKLQKNNLLNNSDIAKQKKLIVDKLEGQNKKIIIVIDDVDRLPNEQIRLIFQLVSTVAKFPNTIYLLSFDRDIVANALSAVQNCKGEDYLEKIVQIPIEVPEVRQEDIQNILFSKLNKIINEFSFRLEEDYWQRVFFYCIDGQIETVRDINRLTNTLYAKCRLIDKEINIIDLIAITIIENKHPDLYSWIKRNKEKLVGGERYSLQMINKDKKTIGQENCEEIQRLFSKQASYYTEMLGVLFPCWIHNSIGGAVSNDDLRRKQRIGDAACFDRYFSLGIKKDELSRELIDEALFSADSELLQDFLDYTIEQKASVFFLKELKAAYPELNDKRKLCIAKSLIEKANDFSESNREGLFSLSATEQAEFLVRHMLNDVSDKTEVNNLLMNVTMTADCSSIQTLAKLLNTTELAFGKLAAKGEKRTDCIALVTKENLSKWETVFINRLEELSEKSDLFAMRSSYLVLYLFEAFDEKGFKEYIHTKFEDDLQILKYTQIFATTMTGTSGVSWEYRDDFKRYVSEDMVKAAYGKCVANGRILNLSEQEQNRIIAYELWAEDKKDIFGQITENAVKARREEIINQIEEHGNKSNTQDVAFRA